ncbi:MAG: TOBE domain-containing protein, partial [Solirubrobacteraceae bacterium]
MKLSARNQLAGKVTAVRKGAAIANVDVDVAGQRIVASITPADRQAPIRSIFGRRSGGA